MSLLIVCRKRQTDKISADRLRDLTCLPCPYYMYEYDLFNTGTAGMTLHRRSRTDNNLCRMKPRKRLLGGNAITWIDSKVL
jgi:hypothetical protein